MSLLPRRVAPYVLAAVLILTGLAVCSVTLSRLLGPRMVAVAAGQAQLGPGEKLVSGGGGSKFDAVFITNVAVGGMQIQGDTPFNATDDWVQNLSISLKNRTNKTIVYVYVLLGFPEAGDGRTEPYGAYDIQLGRLPAADAIGRDGRPFDVETCQKPLSFAPGQTLQINVGDYIRAIKAVVERKVYLHMVTKCAIHLQDVYFEDGMRWNGGRGFGVPDPEHPGRFKYFDRHYFPGDFSQSWPPWH